LSPDGGSATVAAALRDPRGLGPSPTWEASLSDQRGENGKPPSTEEGSEESATRRAASAYQGAVEAVAALLLAMGAGYWVDQRFGTSPRGLLVGTAIGFGSFVLRLWRMRPRDPSA